jgi:hypothetical protein
VHQKPFFGYWSIKWSFNTEVCLDVDAVCPSDPSSDRMAAEFRSIVTNDTVVTDFENACHGVPPDVYFEGTANPVHDHVCGSVAFQHI